MRTFFILRKRNVIARVQPEAIQKDRKASLRGTASEAWRDEAIYYNKTGLLRYARNDDNFRLSASRLAMTNKLN
ncbi:MAG: hypothetical protein LBJ17_04160 [Dysgonamonadaceae bacterium]|jgi:hypothetical protein|nr:hypothetical protein [Dysgonamonadaceae bacterium]